MGRSAGQDGSPKEKRVAEGEMVRWHHRLNGRAFEQTPRESEGRGSPACCGPWGRKESDTTWQLNNSSRSLRRAFRNSAWSKEFTLARGTELNNWRVRHFSKLWEVGIASPASSVSLISKQGSCFLSF